MYYSYLVFAVIDILYHALLPWFVLKRCFSRAKVVRLTAVLLTTPNRAPHYIHAVGFTGMLL